MISWCGVAGPVSVNGESVPTWHSQVGVRYRLVIAGSPAEYVLGVQRGEHVLMGAMVSRSESGRECGRAGPSPTLASPSR